MKLIVASLFVVQSSALSSQKAATAGGPGMPYQKVAFPGQKIGTPYSANPQTWGKDLLSNIEAYQGVPQGSTFQKLQDQFDPKMNSELPANLYNPFGGDPGGFQAWENNLYKQQAQEQADQLKKKLQDAKNKYG